MKWSTEERQGLLRSLDAVERVVVTAYRLLLGLIIAAVMAVVVLVIVYRPWGAGSQGEWFYFSIAVLLVLGWTVGQYVALARRQRKHRSAVTFHSSTEDGVRKWEFRLGPAAAEAPQDPSVGDVQFGFSRSFEIPLASLPAAVLPAEDVLLVLERELERGVQLDEACRLVQPAYADWNERERKAYRLYVTSQLNQRRSTDSIE